MRPLPLFALLAAPTLAACSSSSPAKKALDAATDLAEVVDAPTADAPAEVALTDGSAGDLWVPAEVAAADTASRDGTPIEVLRDVASDVPWDAATVDGPPTAALCTGTYEACQCLCCSTDRRAPTCYFPTLGETVDEIRTAYEASRNPANCGPGSCSSVVVQYVCCTPADPEPPSSATYVATGNVGGIDHLAIAKTGANCATLSFSGGGGPKRAFNIDGGGYWTVTGGIAGPCGDAAAQAQIQGALGTLTLRKAGSDCVADLHATLFTVDSAGAVTTARMDGDGIKMPSVFSARSCP